MHQSPVRQLIADRYSAVHGACPPLDYPNYCFVGPADRPQAALGYRRADEARLFLEIYLDAPVEAVLSERLGHPIARSQIVEIGDHASSDAHATVCLWAEAAERLAGEGEVAVAVLTAPLRRMLRRLGLPIVEIAPAPAERVDGPAAVWGRYYDLEPIVCAGRIDASRDCLADWARAREAAL